MVEPWYYLIGFIFGYCTLCHWIGPPKDNPKTKWPTKYRKRESRWVYLKLCLTVTTPIPMTWSFCWEKTNGPVLQVSHQPHTNKNSHLPLLRSIPSILLGTNARKENTIWITELDKVLQQNSEQMLMDCWWLKSSQNGWPVEISTLSHDLPSTINTQRQPRKFGTFYVAVWFDSIQIRRQCRCNQENGLGM